MPHLSHSDGRKLDFAFYYQTADGTYVPAKTRSPLGYWAFETPTNDRQLCSSNRSELTLRWELVWFRPLLNDLVLDQERTRAALEWLFTSGRRAGVSKVFLEPHMAESLGVQSDILRFQGCRAARHDNHIHIQIGP